MSADLFVADTGEADLPAVVCLHSLFLDHTMFDAFTQAAAGRLRVIRPEFRGQARNGDATETVTMDICADDILDLLARLGLDRVHLVAQSMGGDVAVRVAARRPEAIDRMVMLGSSVRAEPPEQLEAFRPIAEEVSRHGFVGDILEMVVQIMLGETCRNDPGRADVLAKMRADIAALRPGLHHAVRGVVGRESAVDLLPAVSAPTLVVSGGEDIARPPEWSQEVVDGIAGAELWSLPTAGHSVIIEQPDVVIERVLSFLSEGQTVS
ncbi:alpha/beta hydrolase [Aeromicrobium sp. A1-2]|uniref:alpha/beta fold hydrolase n=1 Tax=Aeromicrobium sp. A1-2 TaxID=2107713 RepID=UPI000E518DDE|nr:alpha/beta hydrolase [Aeromicrobium sp. A1-2]AXT86125.1 alpha/beta hydrolase [Aeromicrobium sp. A1-2]